MPAPVQGPGEFSQFPEKGPKDITTVKEISELYQTQ